MQSRRMEAPLDEARSIMAYERDRNSRVSASRRCAIGCSILAAVPVTPLHLFDRERHFTQFAVCADDHKGGCGEKKAPRATPFEVEVTLGKF
jgi:hypothetical protein